MKKSFVRILSLMLLLALFLSAAPFASAAMVENTDNWTNLTADVLQSLDLPNTNCYVVYYYENCGLSRYWVPQFQKHAETLGIKVYGIDAMDKAQLGETDLLKNLVGGKWPILIEFDGGKKYSYANVHSLEDFETIVTGKGKRIVGDYLIQLNELSAYYGNARDLVIPADLGITGIRYRCFAGNNNLRNVTVPEGVENIREFAFSGCRGLLNVYLPSTLKRVEDRAFLECHGNPTLYFSGNQPEITERLAFGAYIEGLNGSRIAAVVPEGNSTWNVAALNVAYPNVHWGAKPGQIKPIPTNLKTENMDPWAVPAVSEAISYGLQPDYLRYHSSYRNNVSRENFCYIAMNLVYKMKSEYSPEITSLSSVSAFKDTTNEQIVRANALNIVNGKGEGKFDPSGKITRQEAACMLQRVGTYLGLQKAGTSMTFADSGKIASWAKEAVDYVTALGIMNGTGQNFDPNGMYTYQQAYATFLRLYQMLPK